MFDSDLKQWKTQKSTLKAKKAKSQTKKYGETRAAANVHLRKVLYH